MNYALDYEDGVVVLNIRVPLDELRKWERERLVAFFGGIAQTVAAAYARDAAPEVTP